MATLDVMIVDDDVASRDLLSGMLRTQFQAKITSAADGVDAMRMCRDKNFSIIFLDIEMPRTDGFEALKVIKSLHPNQFVAMVSGHSSLDYVKKAMAMGANGFIVKPFSTSRVQAVIDKYMSEK